MAYNYYRTVTIDHNKVGGSTLTNFTVLVSLTNTDFKTTVNSGHVQHTSGYDIVFFSDVGLTTPLKFEMERYNGSTGEVVAWVKIPTLSASSDTVIYVGYGNGTISSSQADAVNTWDSSFVGVYHLGDGSSLSAVDSTAIANGSITGATAGTGKVDGGGAFSGSGQFISTGNILAQRLAGDLTLEAWVNPTNFTPHNAISHKSATGNPAPWDWFLYATSGQVGFRRGNGTVVGSGDGNTGVTAGVLTHVQVKMSGTAVSHFKNGVSNGTPTLSTTVADDGGSHYIGQRGDGTSRFVGVIDEVRISNIARSDGWLLASYNTQASPSTFFTLGVETAVDTPPQITSALIEMALGGSFRALCVASTPTAWWRFAETNGDTVVHDFSDSGSYDGTMAGGVTQEEDPSVPDGGYSFKFDGVDGRVTVSLPATGTTVTIEAVIKPNTPAAAGVILSDTTGTVYFGLDSARKLNMFFGAASHLSTAALTDLAYAHVAVVITAGSGTFYINGAASGTFTTFPGFTPTRIGRYDTALPLKAWLDELLVYPTALSAGTITTHYAATAWTNVSADVSGSEKMTLKWGISGNGPTDRIASAGLATISMLNGTSNSAHLLGYYSPLHANCRSGFTHGVLTRVSFIYNGTTYRRFYGKIISIDPIPGKYRERQTRVVVGDLQHDIINTELRNVVLQISQTEAALQKKVLQSVPVTAQPVAIDLDSGLDTSPYAFDRLGAGVSLVRPIAELIASAIGFQYVTPTGVYRYENRQMRPSKSSSATLNDTMIEMQVPSSLDGVFNRIRATLHPKTVDAAATTVLWAQTGTPPTIAAGTSITVWGDYYKTGSQQVKIGGTAQVAPAATTDYLANTASDGSGTNKTANVTVVATPFASTVKFVITNNDAAGVYITFLQIRGKGLYDYSPVTVESSSVQGYGDRPVNVDMPYQTDYNTAKALADYLLAQFQSLTNQAQSVTFSAQKNSTFMLVALTVQVGDRVSLTETVTGLNGVDVFVNGVELESIPSRSGPRLRCKLDLSSAAYLSHPWILEDAAYGQLDSTTVLGFA